MLFWFVSAYNSCNLGEINLKCKYSDPTASLVAVHSKIRVVTNEARTCIIIAADM